MRNTTDQFVENLLRKSCSIPRQVMDKAEVHLNDYMAVTEAGARKNRNKWTPFLRNSVEARSRVIGYDCRTVPETAALINGFNAHCLELDDGQRFAMIHLGAAVISAVTAASDEYNTEHDAILRGIITGYEAACRLAVMIQPSHKVRGFHAAGTCGTIGAAVGVSVLTGPDAARMKRAVTAAAGSAAGMLEMQEQDSELKPYNLGRAAMDGLTAARISAIPFAVPDDILGGRRGFLRLFSDAEDTLREWDEGFEIDRCYLKPYASCRHSHSAVDAAIQIHEELRPDDEIQEVITETYHLAVHGHDHADIHSVASAKMSIPYAVSVALLYGKADLIHFEPLDLRSQKLAKRIRVTENPEFTGACPEKRIARVTVILRNGKTITRQVDYAKGEPENPMSGTELRNKWDMLRKYEPERVAEQK